MNNLLLFLRSSFSALVRLYPRRFREEFQDEMEEVFQRMIEEEAGRGPLAALVAWLKEISFLPLNILDEIRNEQRARRRELAFDGTRNGREISINPGRDAVLAGLPHLAFSIFNIGMLFLNSLDNDAVFEVFYGVPMLVGFLAAAVYAWRQGWPRWSASWYGYWIWAWFAMLANGAAWLNVRFNLFVEWQFTLFLLVLILLTMVVGLFWLFRHDRIRGLLASFFLMPVILPMTLLEFVPDQIEGLLALGSGLVTAACAAWIIQRGDWRTGFLMALGGNLFMGIAYSYVQVFKLDPPFPGMHIVNPPDFFFHLMTFLIGSLALIAGPLAFWKLWDLRGQRGLA